MPRPPSKRSWLSGERLFVWTCVLLFVEVFVYCGTINYIVERPDLVDLPQLDEIAGTARLPEPILIDSGWLREGEWKWPLGGDVLIVPEFLAVENGHGEAWIEAWWLEVLKPGEGESLQPAEAMPVIAPDSSMDASQAAEALSQALRDHGPLAVRLRWSEYGHAPAELIGDFSALDGRLFLVRLSGEDGPAFGFAGPGDIVEARAWPHPMRAQWQTAEGLWSRLAVSDPLGRPLALRLPAELRLIDDGMFQKAHDEGTYWLRASESLKGRAFRIELSRPFLMPPGGQMRLALDVQQ